MAYRWLDDLDHALSAWDIPYVEVGPSEADYTGSDSWRTRGRPASTGDFEPSGILCHHTASPAGTDDWADINCILWGNSSAPGPISTLYLGRTGTVYIVAAGRCNHGGQGIRPGIDSGCEDMNANLLGIEGGNSGVGEFWPDAQIESYTAVVGALCEWYGWPLEAVYLHATTGPPGGGCNSKIDPAGPWAGEPELVGSQTWDLALWRQWCQGTAEGEPPPVHYPEEARGMGYVETDDGLKGCFFRAPDGHLVKIWEGHPSWSEAEGAAFFAWPRGHCSRQAFDAVDIWSPESMT